MSKKNWKLKQRRINLEQNINRYNIIDMENDDEINEENVGYQNLLQKLGRLWEDDFEHPDAHYIFKQLNRPNLPLDDVNEMLMGCGYYAEVLENESN